MASRGVECLCLCVLVNVEMMKRPLFSPCIWSCWFHQSTICAHYIALYLLWKPVRGKIKTHCVSICIMHFRFNFTLHKKWPCLPPSIKNDYGQWPHPLGSLFLCQVPWIFLLFFKKLLKASFPIGAVISNVWVSTMDNFISNWIWIWWCLPLGVYGFQLE